MKSLHIRNLDDATLEGLKRRARRHRRSLQKEVEDLLSDAARMIPPSPVEESRRTLRLNRVSTGHTKSDWTRESIYGDDGR
jgi:plasmid stability protein